MSSLSRDDDLSALQSDFIQAERPIRLYFPDTGREVLQHAQEAVRREYRASVKWKRLRCRSVDLVSKSDIGTIYVLQVGHRVEFDWTWEGATAFRPLSIPRSDADAAEGFPEGNDEVEIDDSIVWMGEILEVDDATGRIFVIVADPEHPPTTGSFFVRPFEFLAFLHAICNEPAFDRIREIVVDRLCASEGGIHPDVLEYRDVGLPELSRWWSKAWSVLWGPPGTGKTFTTGQQAVRSLADPSERILIVSTTNRATDAAAIALGKAAREVAPQILESGALLRIGKGASFKAFAENRLEDMLRGTETEYLRRIESHLQSLARTTSSVEKAMIRVEIKKLRMQMRDAARRNFLDDQVRCVVATAFRATSFLTTEAVKHSIEHGLAPFTTVFIDEAGLISRAATAAPISAGGSPCGIGRGFEAACPDQSHQSRSANPSDDVVSQERFESSGSFRVRGSGCSRAAPAAPDAPRRMPCRVEFPVRWPIGDGAGSRRPEIPPADVAPRSTTRDMVCAG
ncbi:MAG: hypothetical protein KatS3mg111_3893 [Pirellulaceae bacterium]|nr:MAG: hypothetical protein KatS3mg111_3893 [Pirellulaceae bacterium]